MPRKKLNSINDLILFALYSTTKNGESSFENLTKECFNLFPQVFSLKNYSKWPDTRKLGRPLRTLRKKGFINGDPTTSFSLTQKGKKTAKELSRILRQQKLL